MLNKMWRDSTSNSKKRLSALRGSNTRENRGLKLSEWNKRHKSSASKRRKKDSAKNLRMRGE